MERLKRLSEAECRQIQTGSCHDCPVLDIVFDRRAQSNHDLVMSGDMELWRKKHTINELRVESKVGKTLCPPGRTVRSYNVGPYPPGC